MDKFLVEFTEEALQAAKDNWLAQATTLNLPTVDVERLFSWSSTKIKYAEFKNDSHAYGIFDDELKECLAVVDIVHSNNNPQKKLIKMLTVDLCPNLYATLSTEDMSQFESVIDVYSKATFGTIALTYKHSVDVIKLYGRDEPMRLLLTALKERINASPTIDATANWEGWWLAVSPSKKG